MNAISRSTPALTCTGSRVVPSSSSKYPLTGCVPRLPRQPCHGLLQHQPCLDELFATVLRDSQLPRELLSAVFLDSQLPREPLSARLGLDSHVSLNLIGTCISHMRCRSVGSTDILNGTSHLRCSRCAGYARCSFGSSTFALCVVVASTWASFRALHRTGHRQNACDWAFSWSLDIRHWNLPLDGGIGRSLGMLTTARHDGAGTCCCLVHCFVWSWTCGRCS